MPLEPSSPLPLYHQLERVLAERIAEGRYRRGFPGDLELAAEFSVSRGTVRQALERLSRSGLIVRHQRRGSFLGAPPASPLGAGALSCPPLWSIPPAASTTSRTTCRCGAFPSRRRCWPAVLCGPHRP